MSGCNATIEVGGFTVMCGRTRYRTDTHGTMSDDPHRDTLSEIIAECLAWTDWAPGATSHTPPEPPFYAEPSLFAGSTTWGVHDREVRGQVVLFMFDDEEWNRHEAEALADRLNREVGR